MNHSHPTRLMLLIKLIQCQTNPNSRNNCTKSLLNFLSTALCGEIQIRNIHKEIHISYQYMFTNFDNTLYARDSIMQYQTVSSQALIKHFGMKKILSLTFIHVTLLYFQNFCPS